MNIPLCAPLVINWFSVREDTFVLKHPEAAAAIVRDGKSMTKGVREDMGGHIRFLNTQCI